MKGVWRIEKINFKKCILFYYESINFRINY